jgi:tRNA threonylcarbamoyladenosine biosynthesis protein TsaB
MKVLALELSTAQASLAWVDEATEFSRQWNNDRRNSGLFFENLKSVAEQFGPPEKIVVGLGPGSYAGVRIAISAAIGLQAATGAQLVGCPSICAMDVPNDSYTVIGDARRQSFYFAHVRGRAVIDGFELYHNGDLRHRFDALSSSAAVFSSDSLPQFGWVKQCHPSARILARLVSENERDFSFPPLEPIYLREPNITIPKAAVTKR